MNADEPTDAGAVPIVDDPAELTPSWLTDALRAAGVEGEVRDVSVAPVGTGQMASCYRVELTYRRGAGPERLVVKLASTDPDVRASVALAYRAEVGFYRDLADRLPVTVPKCYFAAGSDDGTTFTLLLEDMAPATQGDQLAGCTADEAAAAAVTVAGLHAGSWCDRSLRDLDWLIPSMSSLAEHMGPMLVSAIDGFAAPRDLSAATVDVLRGFAEQFETWATRRPSPWSLVHNDYRLDNLLFAPGANRVTAVDWQSLTIGLPLQDVGFLLGTGLLPDVRRTEEQAIVRTYHDTLLKHGVSDYDAEQCWDDYRHGLFQGPLICLLGDAFATPTERGRQMFSVMAERAATAILDLDSFALLADG